MIGFLIGALCLIGLVKVIRRGRGGFGACGGYGPGGCGGRRGHHHHGGGFGDFGPRMMLRGLFERLQTSPGQENVIVQAVTEVMDKRAAVREELEKSRADVARAVSAPVFDEAALADAFARQDTLLSSLRGAFTHALSNIHGVLDETQRKTLGELVTHGFFRRPSWGAGGGPYRGPWA